MKDALALTIVITFVSIVAILGDIAWARFMNRGR
jgi:hypothetical protein